MSGISRYERVILLLTVLFFLVTVCILMRQPESDSPYIVTISQRFPTQTPQPPENEEEHGWPDSLLPGEQIPINTADVFDLDRLPGIGPSKAQAIVDYRTQHGPFASVEELLLVSGIGPATLEEIQRYVTVESIGRSSEDGENFGGG